VIPVSFRVINYIIRYLDMTILS